MLCWLPTPPQLSKFLPRPQPPQHPLSGSSRLDDWVCDRLTKGVLHSAQHQQCRRHLGQPLRRWIFVSKPEWRWLPLRHSWSLPSHLWQSDECKAAVVITKISSGSSIGCMYCAMLDRQITYEYCMDMKLTGAAERANSMIRTKANLPLPPLESTALESPTFATMSFWPTRTAVTAVHPSSRFPPKGVWRYFLSVSMKASTARKLYQIIRMTECWTDA